MTENRRSVTDPTDFWLIGQRCRAEDHIGQIAQLGEMVDAARAEADARIDRSEAAQLAAQAVHAVECVALPATEPTDERSPSRSVSRTYGTDGDVTVEAVHWPDGTATLRTVDDTEPTEPTD
jgi:hypothetical protein